MTIETRRPRAVAWASYDGRYSDNPRALYEAVLARGDGPSDGGADEGAGVEHTWLCAPGHEHGFPPGVRTVPTGPAWVEALEAADLVVANTHLPVEWTKKAGSTYLQTWHGTPLKRVHRDVLWAPEGLLDALDRDVDRWDVLLSPNETSTKNLRGAFRFDGEVLETGYPRNDVLTSPDAAAVRARVRRELDVPDGVTAVLYTPTWRDDVFYEPGDVPLGLDVAELAASLGEGYCLLLRLHYFVTDRRPAARGAAIRDVSYHPEVSELYLAADAMVTDYSSTMFDFAVTGKPLLFFPYDLAYYRDELRGFYLDLEAEAPGPLAGTAAELAAGLRDLDGVRARSQGRYARFRELYCHLEDGSATDRVLQRVWPR